jgi:coenzyme F420-reducing hydrogenase beta subunit
VSTGAGAGGCAVPQLAKAITTAAKHRTNEIDERFMISLLCGGNCTNPPSMRDFLFFLTQLDVTVVTVERVQARLVVRAQF